MKVRSFILLFFLFNMQAFANFTVKSNLCELLVSDGERGLEREIDFDLYQNVIHTVKELKGAPSKIDQAIITKLSEQALKVDFTLLSKAFNSNSESRLQLLRYKTLVLRYYENSWGTLNELEIESNINFDDIFRFYLSRKYKFPNDPEINNPNSQISKQAIEIQKDLAVSLENIQVNFPGYFAMYLTTDYILKADSPLRHLGPRIDSFYHIFSSKIYMAWHGELMRGDDMNTLRILTQKRFDKLIERYPEEYDHLQFVRDFMWL